MLTKYLFPTTNEENHKAVAAPIRFLLAEFLQAAATMALILVLFDAFWPSPGSSMRTPGVRLYVVVSMGLMMAISKVVAARIRSRGRHYEHQD